MADIQIYEQEIGALLEELKRWHLELAKDPQRARGILEGIDEYMRALGPHPGKALEQTITKTLEQTQWEETQKYIEMSGKIIEKHFLSAFDLLK